MNLNKSHVVNIVKMLRTQYFSKIIILERHIGTHCPLMWLSAIRYLKI